MKDRIEIRFLFSADAITAHLSVRHGFEVKCVDQLIDGQLVGQIGLVSEDEKGDAFQGWLL